MHRLLAYLHLAKAVPGGLTSFTTCFCATHWNLVPSLALWSSFPWLSYLPSSSFIIPYLVSSHISGLCIFLLGSRNLLSLVVFCKGMVFSVPFPPSSACILPFPIQGLRFLFSLSSYKSGMDFSLLNSQGNPRHSPVCFERQWASRRMHKLPKKDRICTSLFRL